MESLDNTKVEIAEATNLWSINNGNDILIYTR